MRKARIVITNYHAFMLAETEPVSKLNRQDPRRPRRRKALHRNGGADGRARLRGLDAPDATSSSSTTRRITAIRQNATAEAERASELTAEERDEAKKNNEEARVWISGIEAFDRVLGIRRCSTVGHAILSARLGL